MQRSRRNFWTSVGGVATAVATVIGVLIAVRGWYTGLEDTQREAAAKYAASHASTQQALADLQVTVAWQKQQIEDLWQRCKP